MWKYIRADSCIPENIMNDYLILFLRTLQRLYSVLMARCYVSYIWPLKVEKMLTNIPAVWKTPGGSSMACSESKSIGHESEKYYCFFITIIPLNFLLGRVISYSEGKIGETPTCFARQIESQSLSVSSNFTGKCLNVCILMLLSRQGARKNWNKVKLITTSVSAK